MFSSKFDKQKAQNLDYILSLAGVSIRGKEMLMRDLDKMEEDEDEDEEDKEGGHFLPKDIAFMKKTKMNEKIIE